MSEKTLTELAEELPDLPEGLSAMEALAATVLLSHRLFRTVNMLRHATQTACLSLLAQSDEKLHDLGEALAEAVVVAGVDLDEDLMLQACGDLYRAPIVTALVVDADTLLREHGIDVKDPGRDATADEAARQGRDNWQTERGED